jgi:hypothetical protein
MRFSSKAGYYCLVLSQPSSKQSSKQQRVETQAACVAHLCPLTLMLLTFGSLKSHSRLGYRKGAMKPPDAASTCTTRQQRSNAAAATPHVTCGNNCKPQHSTA